jgi:hypothetical protein
LDESLGLAIGFRGVGLGEDLAPAEAFTIGAESLRAVAGGGRLSGHVLEALLHQQMQVPFSVHRFHASFSTWAHEKAEFPHELIEQSLAHAEGRGNSVARAYNRGEALERRPPLMQAWAEFLLGALLQRCETGSAGQQGETTGLVRGAEGVMEGAVDKTALSVA